MKFDKRFLGTGFVFLFSCLFFSFYSFPLVYSVDSLSKTFLPLAAIDTHDLTQLITNLWSIRWGFTIPQYLFHLVLPGRIESIFIFQLLAVSAALALTFYTVVVHARLSYQLALTIILVLFLDTTFVGTMLSHQEYGPAFLYLALSIHFILLFGKTHRNSFLLLTGFFLYLTFTCNAIFLAFIASSVLFLFFRKDWFAGIVLLGCFGLFLILDIALFWIISEGVISMGRFEHLINLIGVQRTTDAAIMDQAQLTGDSNASLAYTGLLPGLGHHLSRWIILPRVEVLILFTFFLSLVFWRKLSSCLDSKEIPTLELYAVSALIFFILVSVAVRSLIPVRPLINLSSKYTILFFPLASVVVAYGINQFLGNSKGKALTEAILLWVAVIALVIVWGPLAPNCSKDSDQETNFARRGFCSLFRASFGPNLLPAPPSFFLPRSNDFYTALYHDFQLGRVSLAPPFTLSNLAIFYTLDSNFQRGEFYSLNNKRLMYYSIDGKPTLHCISNIVGRVHPRQDYISCQGYDTYRTQTLNKAGYGVLSPKTLELLLGREGLKSALDPIYHD